MGTIEQTPPSRTGNRKPYYCPFCRALYINKEGYATQGTSPRKYKCLICNSKPYDHSTFVEQQDSDKDYHINGNSDKEKVTLFIKQSIIKLKREGYSHKEVQEITHFSRSMINNITKIHSKTDKSLNLRDFLTDHLLLSQENALKLIAKEVITKEDEADGIMKAITYGCSFDVICKLFNVGRRDVSSASTTYKQNATAQEKKGTDAFKKNYTVMLEENDTVVIKHKK